jgi:hypothetical protein
MARRRLTSGATAICGIAFMAATVAACGSVGANHTATQASTAAPSRSQSPQAAAATTMQPLPAGQQGSQQQVPWAQVGPGWILAEWSATPGGSGTICLFLVDPAGGRYLIDTLPANPTGSMPTILAGWSGDGQRALLTSIGGSPAVAVLNLRTLATTQLALGATGGFGFTTPDGLAIVAMVGTGVQAHLERFSLTGNLELSFPTSFPGGGPGGSAVYSPDGTELALSLMSGIELVSNDGQALRYLPVNPSVGACNAMRWWTASELLVSCAPDGSDTDQLWLVPTSGATATALTASPPASGDLGDLDAWQIPSGTYVQDAGACGYEYLAEVQPSGLTAPVSVPGVPGGDSTIVLGTQGDSIAIDAKPACGVAASLLWFAPANNLVTPILGGPVNGGTVENAVLFGQS